MSPELLRPTRRLVLMGAGLAALASCRLVLPTSEGTGASAAAAARVEAIRRGNGLSAMSADARLEHAAARQAAYMAAGGRMEHTALPGRDFVTRMHEGGIAAPAAENLAWGRMDVERLFEIWLDSPPHRRNLLDQRFARFGLAYASDGGGGRYWALDLAA